MSDWNSPLAVLALIAGLALSGAACSPTVGSEAWCEDMKEKPKGEWTANEASDYTKHCLFQ